MEVFAFFLAGFKKSFWQNSAVAVVRDLRSQISDLRSEVFSSWSSEDGLKFEI